MRVIIVEDETILRQGLVRTLPWAEMGCEIVGEAGGVLVMDDYAHHPTALKATIAGIKEFWPSIFSAQR